MIDDQTMDCCTIYTINTIEDNLYYQNVLMVHVKIDYPQIMGGKYGRCVYMFNPYYQREAANLYNYARTTLYTSAVQDYQYRIGQGIPFYNYELDQATNITRNVGPLFSIYNDVYEFYGGANGITTRTGNTWDLNQCRMISLSELFMPNYNFMYVIMDYIVQEAHRRQEAGEVTYFDNLDDNLQKYFKDGNFYLTPNGVAIFYPSVTIGPAYIGIQSFEVPYELFGVNLRYPVLQYCK